jgi:hypothetical protein
VNLHPIDFANTLNEEIPLSMMSSYSDGHKIPSLYRSARGFLILGQPETEGTVLPDPVPDCSKLPKKFSKAMLDEDHLPAHQTPRGQGEGAQRKALC